MPSLGYSRPIILFQIVLDFPHLRITSGGWARGSRTTLTRKINDTLPRLPHHVFQCCLLSGLLNGRVTGARPEKRATMPSHRTGFAPSTTGFLTLHLSEGLPPKIAVPTFVPGSKPRRDHARAWERNDRARRVRFGCFFSSDDPRVSLGRGIARVRPAFDARLAPRRSRDERGAPNRRDPVRDARQRAEAVRRGKLEGDLRQARAGPRPLQGSLSRQRSVPISDSRTRSSTSDPRVAPSSSRRARRRAVSWHPIIFKSAPPLFVSCAISSRQHDRLNSRYFPHVIPQGRVVCPDAAAEFSRCAHLVVNHTGKQADVPDCSRQLRKMRACLRRERV